MADPPADRKVLEALWRSRLSDAKLRLDFARHYMREVQREYPASDIPVPDHSFAFKKALKAENYALTEYERLLRIYTALTVDGVTPDEGDWLKAQAKNARGEDPENSG